MCRGRGIKLLFVVLTAVIAAAISARGPALAQTLEEKVQELELENGMKFLVVERHEAPVVFCAVAYNVGSANEWPNVTGISHLLEHMMFKGTKMMGTTDFKKEKPYFEKTDALGEKTIELRKEIAEWRFKRFQDFSKQIVESFTEEEQEAVGADRYKQTELLAEKIRAMPALPDSIADVPYLVEDQGVNYLDKYVEYELAWGEISRLQEEHREYMIKEELWDFFTNNGARFLNAFTSNDFTVYLEYLPSNRLELFMVLESDRMESPIFRDFWAERDVVMEERRLGENDPDEQLSEAFYSVAFTASPYNWPVVGWMSDLRTTDREELQAYHDKFYVPNNAFGIVVGDVEFDEVKRLAKKYFEPIPAGPDPPRVETREPEQEGERRLVLEHTANPKLMIGYHVPAYPNPDVPALGVLMSILAGGRTSRLYKSVYEEQQLTADDPMVYTGPGDKLENLLVIEAKPRSPHTLEEVEAAILAEIEKLKEEPVGDREIQRVMNQIDANMIRALGSNMGIMFQVAFGELMYGDYRVMFRNLERIKEVTAEDVRRVAEEYLTEQNRTVAYRVQTEGEAVEESEEEIAERMIMEYVQSLPPNEQMEIFQKFQSLSTDAEREEFGKELLEKAKAVQDKE